MNSKKSKKRYFLAVAFFGKWCGWPLDDIGSKRDSKWHTRHSGRPKLNVFVICIFFGFFTFLWWPSKAAKIDSQLL